MKRKWEEAGGPDAGLHPNTAKGTVRGESAVAEHGLCDEVSPSPQRQ